MKEGFCIGLVREPNCQSSTGNTPSVTERADVISNFLSSQGRAGSMLGPLTSEDCAGVITSHMAVIPKKTPGKWRVIVDLSSPQNRSINDNLHCHIPQVSYVSTDDAAMLMHYLGPGALYKMHIDWCQSTQKTAVSWVCHGRAQYTQTASFRLAWPPHQPFSML